MKSIKESAEEYAATGKVSGTEAIRKRAYLAGAKAYRALAVESLFAKSVEASNDSKTDGDPAFYYAAAFSDAAEELLEIPE